VCSGSGGVIGGMVYFGYLLPQPLETMSGNPGVMGSVLRIAVAKVVLHGPQIRALIGKIIAAGMPDHMGPDASKLGLLASHAHDVVDGLTGESGLTLRDKQPRQRCQAPVRGIMAMSRLLLISHILSPIIAGLVLMMEGTPAQGQTPPSQAEFAAYIGLHKAAAHESIDEIRTLLTNKADPNMRDNAGRTPLHVAAFKSHYDAVRALVAGGSNINALENDRYDVITIAAVKDDARMVKLAIELGGNPGAITSRYDGTALIAAAHLGHDTVVQALIEAGAPVDHVNNLGWTALIEAVVLGDGGKRHVATAKALIAAGANKGIADRNGITPLQHAQSRHYQAMVAILE
jgi:uncharacterized protein